MLVQQEKDDVYYNFINSINSEATRKNYEYCMTRFLKHCNLDLDSLLKLPQQELSNLIIKYLVFQKISSQYKTVIMAAIKHACDAYDKYLPNRILVPADKLTKKVTLNLKNKTFKQIIIASGLTLRSAV